MKITSAWRVLSAYEKFNPCNEKDMIKLFEFNHSFFRVARNLILADRAETKKRQSECEHIKGLLIDNSSGGHESDYTEFSYCNECGIKLKESE